MNIKKLTGLLEKNKTSLIKEIQETKELKDLLLKGLQDPLNKEERAKIKQQLLDVCLGIPALSVALAAPGGAVLILLLYRFLPGWLLPSSFREDVPLTCQASESFCVVDEDDNVIGTAARRECHGNPLLIHRVAHVLVFKSSGEIILQKRSPKKDIQPGKWDTSVGGHLKPNESYREAAYRETAEELGIRNVELIFLYKYPLRNSIESENVATYKAVFDGEINFNPEEISKVRAWGLQEIKNNLGRGVFTPNFEEEFALYLRWSERQQPPVTASSPAGP